MIIEVSIYIYINQVKCLVKKCNFWNKVSQTYTYIGPVQFVKGKITKIHVMYTYVTSCGISEYVKHFNKIKIWTVVYVLGTFVYTHRYFSQKKSYIPEYNRYTSIKCLYIYYVNALVRPKCCVNCRSGCNFIPSVFVDHRTCFSSTTLTIAK